MSQGIKSFLYLILILSLTLFVISISISRAETQEQYLEFAQYRKVYPIDASPKPDIIQDREWRESTERQETEAREQRLLLQSREKEIEPSGVKPPFVGSEPSQIVYRVSVNDRLFISVWRVPELSLEFVVGPDGRISYPLIGDIRCAGKTLGEIDSEITEKLREYVIDPQVSVIIREFAGDRLIILGEVKSPGVYKFVGKTNIMDIIALAGGFTDRARQAYIVVVRESDDPEIDTNLIGVRATNILKGDFRENIEVMPNDIVYVARTTVSHLKEFYNDWITPVLRTVVDWETMRSLRRVRLGATP